MQGKPIIKNSVKIVLCFLLLLVLVQGVQAAETYQFVTKWGSYGSGDGQFERPYGVAVDSSGNVYVADCVNSRIQKFSSTGTFLSKWGSWGTGDGQFEYPYGVAVDSLGNVYVPDRNNNRIQKFNSDGTFLAKWGTPGSGDGQFNQPVDVAVDSSGNVYVADQNNNRIQKFSSTGTFLAKWGTQGTGNGQFSVPLSVAVDSSGNVYVADQNNNRIQKFSSTGIFLAKWGTQGTGNGQFNSPWGIAVDSAGNVYVADYTNNRIQKFNSDGTFLGKWGEYGTRDGQFTPIDIAIDTSGNLYVADDGNNRIQKFAPVLSTFVVSSINPSTATNTGAVNITDLTGTGFMYGAGVKLTKTGSPDIIATSVTIIPPTKITCTFDLTGKATGQWNVVVTNPDGTLPTLPNGFTITGEMPPVPTPLSVTAVFPSTGTNDQSISATVTGTGFKPGVVVRLTLTGQPDIVASGVTLTGNSTIACAFDLTGKTTGTWDLAVTNPGDGTTSVRSTAFTLTSPHRTDATNGTIIVSSTPQDALVYLDGSLKGTGSVTLKDVSPGYHSVRITKTMYNDYGTDVRVAAGSTSYVNAALTPVSGPIISGTIIASSNPAGANVYLDGMDKGISPVTITNVSPGFHTVSFTKTGYLAASRTVTMAAGQTMDVTVDLTKTGGGWEDWLNTTTLIIIGIVVLIIAIIGYLLRKKKNRWDNY